MIKLIKGNEYFISESKTEKVYIPEEVCKRIYDIIRDESLDEFIPTRKIDEEEIHSSVDFIMGEIVSIITEENFLIIKNEDEQRKKK